MKNYRPHSSAQEKMRLIQLFFDSGEPMTEFTKKHGINYSTFKGWLKKFKTEGEDSLLNRADRAYEKIAPQLKTDSDLRKEILRLRIENERLKKSYAVRTTEDGKTEYIRLKAKNTK